MFWKETPSVTGRDVAIKLRLPDVPPTVAAKSRNHEPIQPTSYPTRKGNGRTSATIFFETSYPTIQIAMTKLQYILSSHCMHPSFHRNTF